MYLGYCEEGDKCPECGGILFYPPVKGCSCHINPPCSACVENPLTCNKCGWEEVAPAYKEIPVLPGLTMREYKPRPLDNTKIDYRNKMHTHFSMIKEGVYPEGSTKQEVLEVVRGTFGGRFEYFGKGKFKYIAYTD
jgi:hypothetical protein